MATSKSTVVVFLVIAGVVICSRARTLARFERQTFPMTRIGPLTIAIVRYWLIGIGLAACGIAMAAGVEGEAFRPAQSCEGRGAGWIFVLVGLPVVIVGVVAYRAAKALERERSQRPPRPQRERGIRVVTPAEDAPDARRTTPAGLLVIAASGGLMVISGVLLFMGIPCLVR